MGEVGEMGKVGEVGEVGEVKKEGERKQIQLGLAGILFLRLLPIIHLSSTSGAQYSKFLIRFSPSPPNMVNTVKTKNGLFIALPIQNWIVLDSIGHYCTVRIDRK